MELQTKPNPKNFYDGGVPDRDGNPVEPPDPDARPRISLNRIFEDGLEEFSLDRRIAYRHSTFGEILVPDRLDDFKTDLTSVPSWFTWLVPKSGAHLPAALIHDGLVPDAGQTVPTYRSTDGHIIDRIDADRIFRDAMRDTYVGLIRRWLVWAAVTTRSLAWRPRVEWPWWKAIYYWAALLVTFGGIVYLGLSATADLFDKDLPLLWNLPWMDEGRWWWEALGGLAGAVVFPPFLAIPWGPYYRAGLVAGLALATLFHVTIAVALVALFYQLAEWLAKVSWRATVVAALIAVGAVIAFVTSLA